MERLKKVMIEKGITQYQLAKAIGAKTNTVNNWFTGRAHCPRDNYLNKIASFLSVHPAWLRYGEKHYAPSYTDDVQMIVEKLDAYGKKNPEKLRHKIKLFELLLEEDQFSKQRITIYPKPKRTARRKSA